MKFGVQIDIHLLKQVLSLKLNTEADFGLISKYRTISRYETP